MIIRGGGVDGCWEESGGEDGTSSPQLLASTALIQAALQAPSHLANQLRAVANSSSVISTGSGMNGGESRVVEILHPRLSCRHPQPSYGQPPARLPSGGWRRIPRLST